MSSSCKAGITQCPTDMEIERIDTPEFLVENLQIPIQLNETTSVITTENPGKPSLNNESMLDNSKLFYQKLIEFNQLHGLSLAANAEDKTLDLYMLYKEVTLRGGFALVTKDGRWAEVESALSFRSRAANPCNHLQDLYESLLYQFEIIYFPETQTKTDAPSVMVGSEKLNGLLNHSKDNRKQFAVVPSLMDGIGLERYDSEPVGFQIQVGPGEIEPGGCGIAFGSLFCGIAELKQSVKSSGKDIHKKDPDAPKRIRSAYQIFLHKECDRLKRIYGQNLGQNVRKRAIEAWNCLSENDRKPYIDESRRDKHRFDQEMVVYKERQKMQVTKVNDHPKPKPSMINFQTDYTHNAQFKEGSIDFQSKVTSNAECDDGYHVSLQMEESHHNLMDPDQSLIEFAVKMMENAEKLDASLQIALGDFLSNP